NAKRIVKNYNPKVINYKKYDPKIPRFNQNVKERANNPLILNINKFDINDPNSVSLIQIQIGSNVQSINLTLDTSSNDFGLCSEFCGRSLNGDCSDRTNIFASDNSTSFKGNYRPKSINYLDGSIVNGYTGSDFITINSFTFKNKFLLLLYNKLNGALKAENPVEGIMGLGFSSQIWNQLAGNAYDQTIGFALPNGNCAVGTITFGGMDSRDFNADTNNIYKISTLNDTTYWKIQINRIWIDESPLIIPTPVTDSLISTSHNKISLGGYSSEFFKNSNATKASDGNWIMSAPVPISFDVTTDSGVIGVEVPSCTMIQGKCVSIFDDSSGPLNSIILGAPFLQTIYFIIDNDDHTIRIANKSNFCPNSNSSTSTVLTSFTSTTPSFTSTTPSFTTPSFTFTIPNPTGKNAAPIKTLLPPPIIGPQPQSTDSFLPTLTGSLISTGPPQPQSTDSFLPTLTGSFISTGPPTPTGLFRHTGSSIPTVASRRTDLSIIIGSSISTRLPAKSPTHTGSSPTDSSRTTNSSRGTSQPIGLSPTGSSQPTSPTDSSRHTGLLPTNSFRHTSSLPKGSLSTDSSQHIGTLPKGSLSTDSFRHTSSLPKGSLPTDSSRHKGSLPKGLLPTDSSRHKGSLPKGPLSTDSSQHIGTLPKGSLPTDSSRHKGSLPKGSLSTDSSQHIGTLPKGSLPTDSSRHTGTLPTDSSRNSSSLPTDSSRSINTSLLPPQPTGSSIPTESLKPTISSRLT
ncbi:18560_t:CDS:2, partial [Gigaspora margarita]